eukprot:CAMPEP_0194706476 /NCGR_PEP_ID=MMETSP0295-20121207/29581_1 /TAXON_ID=39354 /ORGANISM="Heterosigma akashiwo, Strain CCMP2393" /LENGTH=411 /DNA_ID=CAMNT_0039602419 /DNA_START=432 /DNA_END=1665 /DNA_ORIENTATION=+
MESITAAANRHTLDHGQRAVLERVVLATARNEQCLEFMDGGPGSGKTHTVRAITECLADLFQLRTVNTALTGNAATHLPGGQTVHTAFNLMNKKAKLPPQQLVELQTVFPGDINTVGLICIDEVSMMDGWLFQKLNSRCQQYAGSDSPFGGLRILMMGDFFQLDPPRRSSLVNLLYTNDPKLTEAKNLFAKFRVTFLHGKHRFLDPALRETVTAVRERPHQEVQTTPQWRQAPILVTGNTEKSMMNRICARNFARDHTSLVLYWKRPLLDDTLAESLTTGLYDLDGCPALFQFFVPGAPCYVTDNYCGKVQLGVANGTRGVMHSLSWEDAVVADHARQLINDCPLSQLELEIPAPSHVNIKVSLPSDHPPWPPHLTLVDHTSRQQNDGTVIIPKGTDNRLQIPTMGKKQEW